MSSARRGSMCVCVTPAGLILTPRLSIVTEYAPYGSLASVLYAYHKPNPYQPPNPALGGGGAGVSMAGSTSSRPSTASRRSSVFSSRTHHFEPTR